MSSSTSFRAAMSRFPTGVVIVTTRGDGGTPYGFTASSFCSVSLEPPMVLVCLATSANCHPAFAATRDFAVSILRDGQQDLARRFATRSEDKFLVDGFAAGPNGSSVVEEALAVVECSVHARHEAGDHVIILGLVERVRLSEPGMPVVYFDRGFGTLK
jgi:flavin reductase ActVB